ncbi:MAG: hypothetical protein KDD61_16375, partial [Bdellovibrionales bacterium]|nr:hypothetical protein [Bdellovibrionales bacterium]
VSAIPKPLNLLVGKKDIKKLVKGLPGLMKDFSEKIKNDLRMEPNLVRRLPQAYREAYSQY